MFPPLTSPQLAALKADILADPVLAAKPMNADGDFDIAVAYNLSAAPAFFVWISAVSVIELMQNGFDWTRVDNLTVGKARIWEFMTATGILNFTRANVRAGIEACWSVEAGDQSTRQAIYDHAQRLARRGERLFATGTGTTTTHHGVGPGTMATEGLITPQDVNLARALP